jgi:hypothetical protein
LQKENLTLDAFGCQFLGVPYLRDHLLSVENTEVLTKIETGFVMSLVELLTPRNLLIISMLIVQAEVDFFSP